MIKYVDTGIVYRNPIPHVKSIHAYFPSAVQLPDGEIVISMALGQAFESADQHVFVCRSEDGGGTWSNIKANLSRSAQGHNFRILPDFL